MDDQIATSIGYEAMPIVESCGDSGWRAGVLLWVDEPRGTRSAKSLGTDVFPSRDAAWRFAESQYGSLAPMSG